MARLMIVGESPSYTRPDGQEHVAFSGKTAHHLWDAFQEAGLSINGHLVTNVVDVSLAKDEKPTREMAQENLPRLLALAQQYQPDIVVTVGKFATESILGYKVKIGEVRGRLKQSDAFADYWVFPIVHPAAAARSKKMKSAIRGDIRQLAAILETVHFNEPRRYSVEVN